MTPSNIYVHALFYVDIGGRDEDVFGTHGGYGNHRHAGTVVNVYNDDEHELHIDVYVALDGSVKYYTVVVRSEDGIIDYYLSDKEGRRLEGPIEKTWSNEKHV